MIEGAIFDVDGTLLDSMAIWEDVGRRYLAKMGIGAEAELDRVLFTMTVKEAAEYIKEQYELQEDVDQIIKGLLNIVKDFYVYEAPLKPGVEAFLKELDNKQIPMAAATASEKEHIEAAFKRLGIDQYFKRIFSCSEVGAGKSQPFIYQKACGYLGTKPEETYVFEDVLYAIETASEAGFKTVGIYDRFSEKDQDKIREKVDIYLEDFHRSDRFWMGVLPCAAIENECRVRKEV